MAAHLFLTDSSPAEVFPAIRVAGFDVKLLPVSSTAAAVLDVAALSVIVDAATDPDAGYAALLDLRPRLAAGPPLVALISIQAMEAHPWHEVAEEILTPEMSAAELRIRLTMLRIRAGRASDDEIRLGPILIDTATYKASIHGRPLDLTFKEFELLRFLASYPGRVFTREKLLLEVWGFGFYGGTRTVDVHVRRLRAKLGLQDEHLIETVRGVGYRGAGFVL